MSQMHVALGIDAAAPARDNDMSFEEALSDAGAADIGDPQAADAELLEALAPLGDADDDSYAEVARAAVTRQGRAPY